MVETCCTPVHAELVSHLSTRTGRTVTTTQNITVLETYSAPKATKNIQKNRKTRTVNINAVQTANTRLQEWGLPVHSTLLSTPSGRIQSGKKEAELCSRTV